jgi:hypothetical protein
MIKKRLLTAATILLSLGFGWVNSISAQEYSISIPADIDAEPLPAIDPAPGSLIDFEQGIPKYPKDSEEELTSVLIELSGEYFGTFSLLEPTTREEDFVLALVGDFQLFLDSLEGPIIPSIPAQTSLLLENVPAGTTSLVPGPATDLETLSTVFTASRPILPSDPLFQQFIQQDENDTQLLLFQLLGENQSFITGNTELQGKTDATASAQLRLTYKTQTRPTPPPTSVPEPSMMLGLAILAIGAPRLRSSIALLAG